MNRQEMADWYQARQAEAEAAYQAYVTAYRAACELPRDDPGRDAAFAHVGELSRAYTEAWARAQ